MSLAVTVLGGTDQVATGVKGALGLLAATTTYDKILTSLISRCSQLLETYLGRGDLSLGTYTEKYDAIGQEKLILRKWPVASIGYVKIDGVALETTAYILLRDGRNGLIVLKGGERTGMVTSPFGQNRWPIGGDPERIEVQYNAGYAAIPADLEQACIELITIWFRRRDQGIMTSSGRLGEAAYTRANTMSNTGQLFNTIPGDILSVWSLYRDITC